MWGSVSADRIKRQKAISFPLLVCVELLFRSLPLQSHRRRGAYLWLDRAERSWAEQDAAGEAGGRLRRRSLFPILSSTSSTTKWRRDTFQVLSSGRSACAQTQRGAGVQSHLSARAHTQALDLAIKGAATGRSCREQKVKTYWILVQRASKQTKSGRGSAAFPIQETNPGCTCFRGTAGFYAGMESLFISCCCGVCKRLCEGHFFWGPSTSSPLCLNIYKVRVVVNHASQRKAAGRADDLDVPSGCKLDDLGVCLGLFFIFRPPAPVSYPWSPAAPCPTSAWSLSRPPWAQTSTATCVHIPIPSLSTSWPQ